MFLQQQNLGNDLVPGRPPVVAAVCSMAVVLLLLIHCLLFLLLFVGVLCLVLVLLCSTLSFRLSSFAIILMGRERARLLCFKCLPDVLWLIKCSVALPHIAIL